MVINKNFKKLFKYASEYNFKSFNKLFKYASEYNFKSFNKLFAEMEATLSFDEFWEAYLIRAQIKLYATDKTILDDLNKIKEINKQPQMPIFSTIWQIDSPNRFIIFPNTHETLHNFVLLLPLVREMLTKWYGDQGNTMVRQFQAEINYFIGDIQTSLTFATECSYEQLPNPIDSLLLLLIQYRCYFALCQSKKAEKCLLEIIRLSKTYPECVKPYDAFRKWVIITTSWNGDSPRFYQDKTGAKLPVLEDRLEKIRSGSSRTTPLELPFVKYAKHNYDNAYELRHLYMDVFHAIYWQSVNDYQQADYYFFNLYKIANTSGIIMPIIECGEQIVPLFKYGLKRKLKCPTVWIDKIIYLAKQYEANLNVYQTINE